MPMPLHLRRHPSENYGDPRTFSWISAFSISWLNLRSYSLKPLNIIEGDAASVKRGASPCQRHGLMFGSEVPVAWSKYSRDVGLADLCLSQIPSSPRDFVMPKRVLVQRGRDRAMMTE